MDKATLFSFVRDAIANVPQVVKYLDPAYKSYDYFIARIEGLVRGVYSGNVGGEFVDILASLIRGQVADAYSKAWMDEGYFPPLPESVNASMEMFITTATNFDYIYGYYTDIIDARVDKTPLAPLLSRAGLWANSWTSAYNQAMIDILKETGGNLEWILGFTEKHCPECSALNGIIMSANEWDTLGVKPQNAPNSHLSCGGWRCDCSLSPTEKRRSPNAYGRVEEIILFKR